MNTYSISQLSREFDITPRTLRFYEEKGMLKPQREGQTRIYSPADRVRLMLILRGKRLGFTLEESFDIISMYSPDSDNLAQLERLVDKIREKRKLIKEQRREAKQMLKELKASEARYLETIAEMTAHAALEGNRRVS